MPGMSRRSAEAAPVLLFWRTLDRTFLLTQFLPEGQAVLGKRGGAC